MIGSQSFLFLERLKRILMLRLRELSFPNVERLNVIEITPYLRKFPSLYRSTANQWAIQYKDCLPKKITSPSIPLQVHGRQKDNGMLIRNKKNWF